MLTAHARAAIAEDPHMQEKLARKARILDPHRNATRSIVERMVDDMIDIASASGGACRDVDLRQRGYSSQAIAVYGDEANRRAIEATERLL